MTQSDLPPRNYFVIPIDDEDVLKETAYQSHKLLLSSKQILCAGALELDIETLAPVYVGSGAFGLVDGQMVREPTRYAGQLVIPGSSLKGACRQIHEVLTMSGSPFAERPPSKRNQTPEQQRKTDQLSRTGALFGLLGRAGRISFDDALPLGPLDPVAVKLSEAYQPDNPQGRRFYGRLPDEARDKQERKIPVLAIPAKARLRTALRFRNVFDYELGSVLLSLGIRRFLLKLGGGKYDPIGWVRFTPARRRLRGKLSFNQPAWEDDRETVERWVDKLLATALAMLPPGGKKNLRALEQQMKHKDDERGGRP